MKKMITFLPFQGILNNLKAGGSLGTPRQLYLRPPSQKRVSTPTQTLYFYFPVSGHFLRGHGHFRGLRVRFWLRTPK